MSLWGASLRRTTQPGRLPPERVHLCHAHRACQIKRVEPRATRLGRAVWRQRLTRRTTHRTLPHENQNPDTACANRLRSSRCRRGKTLYQRGSALPFLVLPRNHPSAGMDSASDDLVAEHLWFEEGLASRPWAPLAVFVRSPSPGLSPSSKRYPIPLETFSNTCGKVLRLPFRSPMTSCFPHISIPLRKFVVMRRCI